MDKIFGSPEDAIADLTDGASVAVTGFGTSYGFPVSLLVATKENAVKSVCLVSNGLGAVGQLRSMMLIANNQVSRLTWLFAISIIDRSWPTAPRPLLTRQRFLTAFSLVATSRLTGKP